MDDSAELKKFMTMLATSLVALIGETTMMNIYHSMYMSTGRHSYVDEFNSHSDRAAKIANEFKKLSEEMR